MNKYIIYIVIAVFAFGGGYFLSPNSLGGTVENFPSWYFHGIRIGGNSSTQVNGIGVTSKSLNPFSLGSVTTSTSTATTSVSISGAVVTDFCYASINVPPTTTSFGADCAVVSSGTAVVTFWNGASAAVTIATSTLRVMNTQTN